MKIVVLDGSPENPGDLSWTPIEELGEVTIYDLTNPKDEAEIIDRINDAEIVITNKTPITKKVLEACPTIECICVLATGFNVVDIEAAHQRNIPVCNVPAYGCLLYTSRCV